MLNATVICAKYLCFLKYFFLNFLCHAIANVINMKIIVKIPVK